MTRFRAVVAGAVLVAAFATMAESAGPYGPNVEVVADLIGCSGPDRARLLAGELVYLRAPTPPLLEAAATIVEASPETIMLVMRRGDLFHANRRVLASDEIPAGPLDHTSLGSLSIPATELRHLPGADPHSDWNLSVTEAALLRDSAKRDGAQAIAMVVRHILAERTSAYRSGGPRAMAPYAREGGAAFSPGAALADLWTPFEKLDVLAPGVYSALAGYPRTAAVDLHHSFYWSVVDADGRSSVVLSHLAESSKEAYALTVERELFVSRAYAVRQTVFGAADLTDGRAIAFYASSSSAVGSSTQPVTASGERSDVENVFEDLRGISPLAK